MYSFIIIFMKWCNTSDILRLNVFFCYNFHEMCNTSDISRLRATSYEKYTGVIYGIKYVNAMYIYRDKYCVLSLP